MGQGPLLSFRAKCAAHTVLLAARTGWMRTEHEVITLQLSDL